MKRWLWLMGSILLIAGLAACTVEKSPEPAADLNGPALIMFYTDN